MPKTAKSAEPTIVPELTPDRTGGPHCGRPMTADDANRRTVHTVAGVTRLTRTIRRSHHAPCPAHQRPYRPEAEGAVALPRHAFGPDVIALIGRLRYADHRSGPEIRAHLVGRGVGVSERAVTNLLDRYDERLAVARTDDRRRERILTTPGEVILALDGLQPDVGHDVRWVLRDVLRGEIRLAKSLPSARQRDLAELLSAVTAAAGGVGAEAPHPADGDRREPGAGREEGGLPPALTQLRGTIRRAPEAAGGAFAPLLLAFGWVHRAAHLLGQEGVGGAAARNPLGGRLGAMRRHRAAVGELGPAVDHVLKVSRSDWPGRFACDDTPDRPRTNNDREQAFGSHRYHERRATGRKGASPARVSRGSARLVAGLGTRAGAGTAADLAGADREEWKRVRAELEERRPRRVERRRFRRDPEGYLKDLENQLIQSRLPA